MTHTQCETPKTYTLCVCVCTTSPKSGPTHPHSAAPFRVAARSATVQVFQPASPSIGIPYLPLSPRITPSEQGVLKLIATETTNNG